MEGREQDVPDDTVGPRVGEIRCCDVVDSMHLSLVEVQHRIFVLHEGNYDKLGSNLLDQSPLHIFMCLP